jgi:site-specific recombinase XerD
MSLYKTATEMAREAAAKRLDRIESEYQPFTAYNGDIFSLYLKYCRRRQISYDICQQAERLKSYLENYPLKVIKSWEEAVELDRKNILQIAPKQLRHQGKPFRKIALMLVEVGGIELPLENHRTAYEKILGQQSPVNQKTIAAYFKSKIKHGRSDTTLYMIAISLNRLSQWLERERNINNLLLASSIDLSSFLSNYAKRLKKSTLQDFFHRLNHFFAWAQDSELLSINPMPHFAMKNQPIKHRIITENQVKMLLAVIRSPQSDPDQAMLLCMMLLFACSIEHCRTAKIKWSREEVEIYWLLEKKSFRQRKQRTKNLRFSPDPRWFRELLSRYLKSWQSRYHALREKVDHAPLFIQENSLHAHGCGRTWIASRVAKATEAATGSKIPCHILRQTAAVIHKRGEDTSLLTQLGWAGNSAQSYSIIPTTYYSGEADELPEDDV